jgi:hypothetical protein
MKFVVRLNSIEMEVQLRPLLELFRNTLNRSMWSKHPTPHVLSEESALRNQNGKQSRLSWH